MKHPETLQEKCLSSVGHHLESYPPDILSRLPGTFVTGLLPHLCQHHLNSCHDDIIQTGVDPNPAWHALFASHFKWESRMRLRVETTPSHDGRDEDRPDWRQQYLQRYFHKLLWYQSRSHRTQEEDNRETLLLTASCSDQCLRAAQDLMLYSPHVHRLILYDSRAFNYILQDQLLHRCLLEHVEHLEMRWFRGLPGVGTFLRGCLASPISKLEKLTMYGVPGGTDKSALQLLSLCAGAETHANETLCPHCNNTRHHLKESNVLAEDFLGDDYIDIKQDGIMNRTSGPHSARIPPQQNMHGLHSDETLYEDEDEDCRSRRRTDSSDSVNGTVLDTRTSDSEDLYDIAVGAGCSTSEDSQRNCVEDESSLLPGYPRDNCSCGAMRLPVQNSDTGGITNAETLPLLAPPSTKHHGTVREIILHDVLTSPSLVRSFSDLLKTWYSLERVSISGGSYDSLPKDDVVSSLLECQRKGGKLTHLFLENELLSHWMFPNILLSLLQAKQSNIAANSSPHLKQLKLHHCIAFGRDVSHWRPVCWNSFPTLSSGGVMSGIVSVDLSFCVPTLDVQPSRPLDMSALTWLIAHDSALRSLRLHNCQLYTEELATVFNAISEAPDSSKLEMLDVSFNNYRSENLGSGALAQLISKSRLTCLKMEVVSSISAGRGGCPIVTSDVVLALRRNTRLRELWLSGNRLGDAGVETLMQVFAPGGHSCLQVLALRSNLIHTRGLQAINRSLWTGTHLRTLLIGGNFLLTEPGGNEGVEALRRLVAHVDTGLPSFLDSAALMVEHVAQM
ncbi:Hypp5772 [Branchiostoma lanceolatum]|uniref:Leucine-rich repeat-containing protein 41 n=1 Tax=Branchiostoma lanceolatum TaxID=7740 RepID=A0A8J9W4A0_BRALA|nr:Hypp5772 [Branchiostoma lanceolatum]